MFSIFSCRHSAPLRVNSRRALRCISEAPLISISTFFRLLLADMRYDPLATDMAGVELRLRGSENYGSRRRLQSDATGTGIHRRTYRTNGKWQKTASWPIQLNTARLWSPRETWWNCSKLNVSIKHFCSTKFHMFGPELKAIDRKLSLLQKMRKHAGAMRGISCMGTKSRAPGESGDVVCHYVVYDLCKHD